MPTRKLADLPQRCRDPEHEPSKHVMLDPGVYEHECPACGAKVVFTVTETECLVPGEKPWKKRTRAWGGGTGLSGEPVAFGWESRGSIEFEYAGEKVQLRVGAGEHVNGVSNILVATLAARGIAATREDVLPVVRAKLAEPMWSEDDHRPDPEKWWRS